MLLHEFGHIQPDHGLLAAVKLLSQGPAELCFTHTGGPGKEHTGNGPVGSARPLRPGGLQRRPPPPTSLWPMTRPARASAKPRSFCRSSMARFPTGIPVRRYSPLQCPPPSPCAPRLSPPGSASSACDPAVLLPAQTGCPDGTSSSSSKGFFPARPLDASASPPGEPRQPLIQGDQWLYPAGNKARQVPPTFHRCLQRFIGDFHMVVLPAP